MATPLEQFVNTIRNFGVQENHTEIYVAASKAQETLQKNVQHLDNVLETFNYEQHSLGILAVLIAKFSTSNNSILDNSNKLTQAREFILNCDVEQVRVGLDLFAEFGHLLTSYFIEQKIILKGITILKIAIKRLKYCSENQLSSIHADLCQLCLLAKCFKPALEILDVDIVNIAQEIPHNNQSNPQFDAKYFLLYYYYGGNIYLALRNLDRALYFFEVALTTPAHAVSHIMLEAYKKFILVSLLLHGKVQQIPKYSSKVVMRFVKPLSQAYHELANAFVSNNSGELNSVLNKHRETFVRDKNLGLVKQVGSVLYKKNIQRLTKTFLTLSLSDVASRVGLGGPAEAEKHILSMIENGEIYATINQKDGMVVFNDEPDKYCGPTVLKSLEEDLTFCMEFNNRILAMDEEIQINPQYVRKSSGMADDDQPAKSIYAI